MEETNNQVHLIVQYYRCPDAARQAEIDTCLRNNLLNLYLTAIHLLTEEQFDLSQFPNPDRIVQIVIGQRLTYEQAFTYANEADPEGRGIWVLANADIWFDESLQHLAVANLAGVAFALTRHDIQSDGSICLVHPQYAHGSQDTWIFRTPLPLDRMFTSFCLGIPGCEQRIAHELVHAGYVVLNPSLKIIARHLDLSRGFHIDDRTIQYMALMTEESFKTGKAAPPPHQVFLYPTDQLSLSAADHFRNYLEAAAKIKNREDFLADRNNLLAWRDTQLAEQSQQLELKDRWLAENEQHIAALYAALADRDANINALKTSLSWKITAPLRKVHTTLNVMLGRQPDQSVSSVANINIARTNDYVLSLVRRDAPAVIPPLGRTVDVLLPVYNAYEFTRACLDSLLANSKEIRLIVIDDASPDERIWPLLEGLTNIPERNIKIIISRNEQNLGFVKSVNRAFGFTENDFVILNSDTEVPPGWLDRLLAPLDRDDRIATVTPFSNAATICSFPNMGEDNPLYLNLSAAELDGYFKDYAPSETVEIPTGIGFCMACKRSVVEEIGFFNEEVFGRGYGEENDFCMRARKAGYRNVIVPNLFVFHKHGGSFSTSEKTRLATVNLEKLINIYPEYPLLVNAFIVADPLREIRDALKLIIASREHKRGKIVAVFDFDLGGGSGLYSSGLLAQLAESSHMAIHVSYSTQTGSVSISCMNYEGLNLTVSREVTSLVGPILSLLAADFVIVNQLVSWPEPLAVAAAIGESGIPYLILLHDYFYVCPNWVLLNAKSRFCNASGAEARCVACFGNNSTSEHRYFYGETLDADVVTWKRRMYQFLSGARQLICFSGSSQALLLGFYPGLTNTVVVEHAVPDSQLFKWHKRSLRAGEQLTVGVIGNIGVPKGVRIIGELLDHKMFKELPINIVVFGNTSEYADGYRSPDGRLLVYGKYSRSGLPALLEKYGVSVILIPSIWPETFSFTTSEAMLLGYPVICFDIGAQAERVKQCQCGIVAAEISAEGLVKTFKEVIDNPGLVEELSIRTRNYVTKTAGEHFSSITSVISG